MTDDKQTKYRKYKAADDKKRVNDTVSLVAKSQSILGKAFGKKGIIDVRIISNWADIVGAELSNVSAPKKISYKKGQKDGGVLHISVVGAFATEMAYQDGIIIEKVNSFIGRNAVSSVKITHDFVVAESKPQKQSKTIITDCNKLDKMLSSVDDADLKQALQNIGKHIIGKKKDENP